MGVGVCEVDGEKNPCPHSCAQGRSWADLGAGGTVRSLRVSGSSRGAVEPAGLALQETGLSSPPTGARK